MEYKDHPTINRIAKVVGIHSYLKLVMGCGTANLVFPCYISNLLLKEYKFQLQMAFVNISIYPNVSNADISKDQPKKSQEGCFGGIIQETFY
jgi:hypothetical protein